MGSFERMFIHYKLKHVGMTDLFYNFLYVLYISIYTIFLYTAQKYYLISLKIVSSIGIEFTLAVHLMTSADTFFLIRMILQTINATRCAL